MTKKEKTSSLTYTSWHLFQPCWGTWPLLVSTKTLSKRGTFFAKLSSPAEANLQQQGLEMSQCRMDWVSTVSPPLQGQLHLFLHPRTTELGRCSTLSTEILGYVHVFCSGFYPCQVHFPSLPLSSWCLPSLRIILFKGFPV